MTHLELNNKLNVCFFFNFNIICDKIYFGTADKINSEEKLLFSEDSLEGLRIVKENTQKQECSIDIELLFNAVFANKTRFRELFGSNDEKKGQNNGI